MRVLLVSPFSAKIVGGIGTWTKSVLDYNINDNEVELFFLNTHLDIKRYIKGHFSIVKRIIIGSIDSCRILLKLFICLIIHKPEVVHYTSSAGYGLHKDKIALFIVKSIFNKKMVIHWHFGRIPEMQEQQTYEYNMLKQIHCKCDASILLDIKSQKSLIKDGLNNVFVVPNAVTRSVYDYAINLNISKVQKERLTNNILFVGHILPAKGVFELVTACSSLNNVNLTIVGPDISNSEVKLRNIAKSRDNGKWLTFTGELNRDDVLPYYQKCSIFCLPSYTEGFPYAILESMSCGCPIIATSVGAIPDMLSEDCGIIVESRNVMELKNAIAKLIANRDLALTLGINAHQKVTNRYSIKNVYNSYKEIWKKVIWG